MFYKNTPDGPRESPVGFSKPSIGFWQFSRN